MPYLDQTGLSTFWTKIKTWASTNFGATISKGTSTSSGLPIYLKDKAATPNTLSTVTITKSDITALGIPGSDTTYTPATQSSNGLMSAADKKKLDGVADGANKYVHPTSAAGAKASGMYKVSTDDQGHVTGATAVTKDDITALGIPGSDTTYTHPAGNVPDKAEGLYKFSTDSKSHVSSVTTVTKEDISPLESDPTVPAWAKAASKPSYQASEIECEAAGGESVDAAIETLFGYTSSNSNSINSLVNSVNTKAPTKSPAFTGTPTAPTASAGTNTTQVATCAFVQSAVVAASTGAAKYQGGITSASYQSLTTYKQGWYWVVTEAGTIAGESCEVGDMVFCNTDNTASGTKSNTHFDVVQTNITSIPDATINALS